MDMDRSLTPDEDMEMQRFLQTFTMDYNGVPPQSAGGSLIWPPGQHNVEEEEEDDDEAAQFSDQASDYSQDDDTDSDDDDDEDDDDDDDEDDDDDDDDNMAYQFDPEYGYNPTEETVQTRNNYYFNLVVSLNLLAHQLEEDFETVLRLVFGGGGAGILGAFVVPASDAAVAGLEKRAFHATAAEGRGDSECGVVTVTAGCCPICLEDFEDGEEVSVMPCSGGHEFHTDCITKWLGRSNMCPLCRHALPVDCPWTWMIDGP